LGDISADDIRGGGARNLTVNTNTCAYTPVYASEGGCGIVSLQWKATDVISTEKSGRNTKKAGNDNLVRTEVGTSKLFKATITGQITITSTGNSKPFDGGIAEIGSSTFSELKVEKVH